MEEKGSNKRQYNHLESYFLKFSSNDSQASNGSYESSLSSNEQKNYDDIEYFRQEMSRFFINYPELMNNQLLGSKEQAQRNEEDKWQGLANHIFQQVKEEQISLQTIAKRIAYYRKKTQQVDVIDLIAKQKDNILKEIDQEASADLNENINMSKAEQVKRSSSLGIQNTQNVYISWKKRNQRYVIDQSRQKSQIHKSIDNFNATKEAGTKNKMRSLYENQSHDKRNSRLRNHRSSSKNQKNLYKLTKQQQIQATAAPKNHSFQNYKNYFKFQPKTDVGKQLLEEIKKHPQKDQIAIKKTIVNFISKYRENLQKQMKQKCNLPQRLSKLHIEDSKELLLFCPIKKQGAQTQMPLNNETEQFLSILKQISQGHLMKYWRLLQQKKL